MLTLLCYFVINALFNKLQNYKKMRLKKKKIPNTNGTTKGKAIVSEEMKSCQANVTWHR